MTSRMKHTKNNKHDVEYNILKTRNMTHRMKHTKNKKHEKQNETY